MDDFNGYADADDGHDAVIDEPRRPGRRKGSPKVPGSGRKAGTPNRSTMTTRERIQELADPIAFLADVMAGKRMTAAGEPGDMKRTWCYPTLAQRVQASETLLRKLLPDLKATELSGPDGAPLVEVPQLSLFEASRRLMTMIQLGELEVRHLAEMDAPTTDAEPEDETETPGAREVLIRPAVGSGGAPGPSQNGGAPPASAASPAAAVFLEERRTDGGESAWLAMSGEGKHRTFHCVFRGDDARQQARDWVGKRFGVAPYAEVEVPQDEGERDHGNTD